MKHKLLDWIICPITGSALELIEFSTVKERLRDGKEIIDVDEGVLLSKEGRVYPIIEGVPRMIEGAFYLYSDFRQKWNSKLTELKLINNTTLAAPSKEFINYILPTLKRFEEEWKKHNVLDRTWGLDQPTRINHFLNYIDMKREDVKGKLVLDAGAGTGQLTCSYATLDCEVVGVDLSPAVLKGWRLRKQIAPENYTNIHIVQGNLMMPPFRNETFDIIHSSGVLHHTPDTRKTFNKVTPLTKKEGVCAVWLYKEIPTTRLTIIPMINWKFLTVDIAWLRKFTPRLSPSLLYFLIYSYSAYHHLAYKINALVRNRKHNQTIKERTTSLFDTLAPPYVWKHTPAEVMEWYKENGFNNIRDTSLTTDIYGFNIVGLRIS